MHYVEQMSAKQGPREEMPLKTSHVPLVSRKMYEIVVEFKF
jgi:hypothetical protein